MQEAAPESLRSGIIPGTVSESPPKASIGSHRSWEASNEDRSLVSSMKLAVESNQWYLALDFARDGGKRLDGGAGMLSARLKSPSTAAAFQRVRHPVGICI